MKYTFVIQLSDENECFVVKLPEFTDVMQPYTYEKAIKNAQEVLEMVIEYYQDEAIQLLLIMFNPRRSPQPPLKRGALFPPF